MSPHELQSESRKMLLEALRRQQQLIDRLAQIALLDDMPALVPTREEQEIIALFDRYPEGERMTREVIADLLGKERDNGTLAARLRGMVKRGFLGNDRRPPGYYLIPGHCADQEDAPGPSKKI